MEPALWWWMLVGVVSSASGLLAVAVDDTDAAEEPGPRFRDLMVTELGMPEPGPGSEERGDGLGGVLVVDGAGSFERADCTRASSRCIWAVSVRMCASELDGGIL